MKSVSVMSVLDLSGVSQANIAFVTEGGHKLSSDDMVGAMLQNFGDNFEEGQRSAENAARFLENTLTFPKNSFDGALAWDVFQFLTPPLVEQTVEKLLHVVRPGGLILAFFNADQKVKDIPLFSYKIQDARTLQQTPRGGTQRVQPFLHRTIEKLFESASSVQFFLTRDHLYEVLVRR
jgi:SAM-dependent methyltransferase